jgi:TRAP-type C4-dicarboxylate transport system permease small subunit
MDSLVNALLSFLIASIVGVMLVSVVFRYVLNSSLSWSDEFVRYLFVWLTLLGSAVVFRDREHIRIDYFISLCPPKLRRVIEVVILCAVTFFFLATLVLGVLWVRETNGTLTSALSWPLNWFFYAALPASSLLGVWYAFRQFFSKQIGEQPGPNTDESARPKGTTR